MVMRCRSYMHLGLLRLHCVANVAWRASYEVADTQQVDIDFDVHYLMQELDGKLRIFGNEQELLKKYGIIEKD